MLVRVLVGSAFGLASPVKTLSPTLYVDIAFEPASGAALPIPAAAEERALYSVDHDIELDGERVAGAHDDGARSRRTAGADGAARRRASC